MKLSMMIAYGILKNPRRDPHLNFSFLGPFRVPKGAAITENHYTANKLKNNEVQDTNLMSGPKFLGVIYSETLPKLTLYLPWPLNPPQGVKYHFFTKNDPKY